MTWRQLPNAITGLRIALVPALGWLLHERDWLQAAGIVVLAAATDWLDGFLARRYRWQSHLGSLLDPIADKLMIAVAFVGLFLLDAMPDALLWIVLARDLVIVAGGVTYRVLVGPVEGQPSLLGKLTSPAQLAYVVYVLLDLQLGIGNAQVDLACVIAVAALTVASGAGYVWEWSRRARRNWQRRDT